MSTVKVVFCLCILAQMVVWSQARGVLSIKLLRFHNPRGLTYDGNCCDPTPMGDGFCQDQCDYVLRLIISGLGRANEHVFLFHRPLKYDSNNLRFQQPDNNVTLTVLFDTWPSEGQVSMNVFFYDYDESDHTTALVDWFQSDLQDRGSGHRHQEVVRGNRPHDKTRMVFQWSRQCQNDHPSHGQDDLSCLSSPPQGHVSPWNTPRHDLHEDDSNNNGDHDNTDDEDTAHSSGQAKTLKNEWKEQKERHFLPRKGSHERPVLKSPFLPFNTKRPAHRKDAIVSHTPHAPRKARPEVSKFTPKTKRKKAHIMDGGRKRTKTDGDLLRSARLRPNREKTPGHVQQLTTQKGQDSNIHTNANRKDTVRKDVSEQSPSGAANFQMLINWWSERNYEDWVKANSTSLTAAAAAAPPGDMDLPEVILRDGGEAQRPRRPTKHRQFGDTANIKGRQRLVQSPGPSEDGRQRHKPHSITEPGGENVAVDNKRKWSQRKLYDTTLGQKGRNSWKAKPEAKTSSLQRDPKHGSLSPSQSRQTSGLPSVQSRMPVGSRDKTANGTGIRPQTRKVYKNKTVTHIGSKPSSWRVRSKELMTLSRPGRQDGLTFPSKRDRNKHGYTGKVTARSRGYHSLANPKSRKQNPYKKFADSSRPQRIHPSSVEDQFSPPHKAASGKEASRTAQPPSPKTTSSSADTTLKETPHLYRQRDTVTGSVTNSKRRTAKNPRVLKGQSTGGQSSSISVSPFSSSMRGSKLTVKTSELSNGNKLVLKTSEHSNGKNMILKTAEHSNGNKLVVKTLERSNGNKLVLKTAEQSTSPPDPDKRSSLPTPTSRPLHYPFPASSVKGERPWGRGETMGRANNSTLSVHNTTLAPGSRPPSLQQHRNSSGTRSAAWSQGGDRSVVTESTAPGQRGRALSPGPHVTKGQRDVTQAPSPAASAKRSMAYISGSFHRGRHVSSTGGRNARTTKPVTRSPLSSTTNASLLAEELSSVRGSHLRYQTLAGLLNASSVSSTTGSPTTRLHTTVSTNPTMKAKSHGMEETGNGTTINSKAPTHLLPQSAGVLKNSLQSSSLLPPSPSVPTVQRKTHLQPGHTTHGHPITNRPLRYRGPDFFSSKSKGVNLNTVHGKESSEGSPSSSPQSPSTSPSPKVNIPHSPRYMATLTTNLISSFTKRTVQLVLKSTAAPSEETGQEVSSSTKDNHHSARSLKSEPVSTTQSTTSQTSPATTLAARKVASENSEPSRPMTASGLFTSLASGKGQSITQTLTPATSTPSSKTKLLTSNLRLSQLQQKKTTSRPLNKSTTVPVNSQTTPSKGKQIVQLTAETSTHTPPITQAKKNDGLKENVTNTPSLKTTTKSVPLMDEMLYVIWQHSKDMDLNMVTEHTPPKAKTPSDVTNGRGNDKTLDKTLDQSLTNGRGNDETLGKTLYQSLKLSSTLPKITPLQRTSDPGPKVLVPDKGLYVPRLVPVDESQVYVNESRQGTEGYRPEYGTAVVFSSQTGQSGIHRQEMSVQTVFHRYWPAILGVTVGTVFLVLALLTSLACRQQRLLAQRRRAWQQDTPHHVTTPPPSSSVHSSSTSSLSS